MSFQAHNLNRRYCLLLAVDFDVAAEVLLKSEQTTLLTITK